MKTWMGPSHAPALLRGSVGVSLGVLALLAGCVSSGSKSQQPDDAAKSTSAWLEPSPLLRQQIADEAQRLPWTHGIERLEQIRWFASVGEPAYPTLLELAASDQGDAAAAALAALGATGDRRLVPAVRAVPWPEAGRGRDLDLERARSLVRLGDWDAIPSLIEGLRDERTFTRSLCLQALREATGESFGFDARGEERDREESIELWARWWGERSAEDLLASRAAAPAG